jgi:GNAT superfamily N-acetyltransferase
MNTARLLPTTAWNLPDQYVVQELNADDFWEQIAELSYGPVPLPLNDEVRRLYFVLRYRGEIVGWHHGYRQDSSTYTLQDSAILPAYRGKGLYTLLLNITLAYLRHRGFRIVRSRHAADLPAVLIPKLRAGFQITGLSCASERGPLVELRRVL